MQKIVKRLFSAPSIRLNTLVVLEVVILLMVSLGGLFYFTRKSLVEESKKDALQRLEGAVQHVDNVLLSIEQTAGNFYIDLSEHLNRPDRIQNYCRHMVECNPNIMGCAIAFKPGYYEGRDLFMSYVHRRKYNSPELVITDQPVNIPYTKQEWYTTTMTTGRPGWIDPRQNIDSKSEPVVTFCLPIHDKNHERVGVMGVGLSVNLLSQIVLENKPSPHSYSLMLGHDGTYIVHPDRKKLSGQTVFDNPDVANSPTAIAAARATLKGVAGEGSFSMNDETWYAFYKPFVRNDVPGRSMESLEWTISTIYPKADIFGEYNHLVFHVLGIVLIGLLVFHFLARKAIRGQMKPLAVLTESAERIAEGHYDDTISDTKRTDEIGVFQRHFQVMQQALAADISRQEEQQAILNERHEQLRKLYREIQENDQVKTTFLHNVTNRMIAPSESILESVTTLCDNYQDIALADANRETENIKQQSETILELLSHKFTVSSTERRKEVDHE